ncbi:hypothetical protein P8452_21299 [Trifolium repens]|nr:hypothetical protein P8452_21299 [Trifolium repens]
MDGYGVKATPAASTGRPCLYLSLRYFPNSHKPVAITSTLAMHPNTIPTIAPTLRWLEEWEEVVAWELVPV